MSLKVKNLVGIMENFAPPRLKEDYDNVGLMVGERDREVTSILVALDCTLEVIEEAKEKGCNFILTHHPLLFMKPRTITSETLKGRKIISLIKNDIALYSSHTNLDSVTGGLNDIAAQLLGAEKCEIMEKSSVKGYDDNSGVGRFLRFEEAITLQELCQKVKIAYGISNLRYSGEDDKLIKRIALINGSGEDFFPLAKRMGAQCIITGDTRYHHVSDIIEEGIAVIDAGHFETEWPPMKIIGEKLEGVLKDKGYENKVIISEKSVNAYKFV